MTKQFLLAGIAAMCLGVAYAGGPPTYKCHNGARIEYSDEPCVAGEVAMQCMDSSPRDTNG